MKNTQYVYFRTQNKLQSHKKLCEDKDFCDIIMPSKQTKTLEFDQNQKSNKEFTIY